MADISILIVDNCTELLEVQQRLLSLQGYQCEIADSPQQAMKLLAEKTYTLALLDLRLQDEDDMSDVSGISVAKWLSSNQRQTKVIIQTAYPTYETVREVLGLGIAVDYISKAEGPHALITRIQEIVKST